jgi:hypothetical protein
MELKWLIPLCLLLSGCAREQMDDCLTSTGPLRREERAMAPFHAVDVADRIDVVLEDRYDGTVIVEAGRSLLPQVETVVVDGVLTVRNDNRCNWVRSYRPRITLFVPIRSVERLVLRGSGAVNATDTIRGERFAVEQWGGEGTVSLCLDVQYLSCALHSGVGDAILRGRCSAVADLYSGVLGAIDASALRTAVVNVNNSGVADIRCWAEDQLAVQVLSRGDVYYRGTPASIQQDIRGSGGVFRMD